MSATLDLWVVPGEPTMLPLPMLPSLQLVVWSTVVVTLSIDTAQQERLTVWHCPVRNGQIATPVLHPRDLAKYLPAPTRVVCTITHGSTRVVQVPMTIKRRP